jgi:AsmA-like C-terminal region
MTRFKKISLWAAACFIFCIGLVAILVLFSDRLINQKPILEKIQAEASSAINGKVTFERLDVSFFPRPQLLAQQCRFFIPETTFGTIASVTISPKVIPLISGKFQLDEINLNSPDIKVHLKQTPESQAGHHQSFALKAVEENMGPVVATILSKSAGLHVRMKTARLTIFKQEKPLFWLRDINAGMDFFQDHIDLDIGCDTKFWKGIALNGSVFLSKDRLSFSMAHLRLNNPHLNLSGKLDIDQPLSSTSPSFNLKLTGKEVDIDSIRKAALDLDRDAQAVADIFNVIKSGEIPLIQLTSHGKSMEELGELENIIIKGRLANGKIFVPKVDLNLSDVSGDVVISNSILYGKALKARMKTSKCLDGSLKLGLKGKDAPFHLDLTLSADLAQLPPILKRVVHNKAFIKENSLIDHVRGRATGRLILGESIESVHCNVNISHFNLSANYRRLPYPLIINDGQYFLNETATAVKNASGSMGASTFTEVSGQVDWDGTPHLNLASGNSKIDLKEIYPWLKSFNTTSDKLKDLKNVKGVLTMASLSLDGPFFEPHHYRFQMTGNVQNLAVDSSLLPGPLELSKGNFSVNSKNLIMTGFQTRILDALLTVSGTLKDYSRGLSSVDLIFQGETGPDATGWIEDTLKLSPRFRFNPPVSFSTAHLTWNHQQHIDFSGDLLINKGQKISMDFSINPGQLTIKNLAIQDTMSNASIQLTQTNRTLDVLFAGNLKQASMDRILVKNEILKGQMEGNFSARVPMAHPLSSKFQGELKAKNLIFSGKAIPPLVIKDLSLKGNKDILQIESARLILADNLYDLKGKMDLSAAVPKLTMKLYTKTINIDQLKKVLDENSKKTNHQNTEKSWTSPVRGILTVIAEKLTYGKLTWHPFEADVRFNDKFASVSITDADICGITTLGKMEISPWKVSIDVKPFAQNQKLNPSIQCLLDKSAKIVGNYNLEGDIKAQGTGNTLMQNIHGDLTFDAPKGRSYAGRDFRTLIKIFSLLNVTDIFKEKLPDIENKGFAYNSIRAKADIQHGKIKLNEMIVDGESMNIVCQGYIDLANNQMDVTALIAPLKTIDFFIKKIPVVRYILGGSLISIPVGIKGSLENPEVTPIPPSAVGSGLLGIVKRTLQLPVKIIQPFSPK